MDEMFMVPVVRLDMHTLNSVRRGLSAIQDINARAGGPGGEGVVPHHIACSDQQVKVLDEGDNRVVRVVVRHGFEAFPGVSSVMKLEEEGIRWFARYCYIIRFERI